MTQIYPVNATLKAPDWIDGLVIGNQPVVTNQFQSKSESRLRLSSVPAEAEIVLYYNLLLSPALNALLTFYQLVGTFEDFTLPTAPNFFATGCPAWKETLYRSASPLSKWRYKDRPVLTEMDMDQTMVVCQLISCVD